MECMPPLTDRAEDWSVYKKISKCPFAWLYGHCVSLGYFYGMAKFLMEGLGLISYYMTREASTFDRETLEVEVEFNENQSEIDLHEMKKEFGLDDDSVNVDAPEIQNEVVTEMVDARTLELFRGGRVNSMVQAMVPQDGPDLKDLLEHQQCES